MTRVSTICDEGAPQSSLRKLILSTLNCCLAVFALLFALLFALQVSATDSGYRDLYWEDLIPEDFSFKEESAPIDHFSDDFEIPPQLTAPVVHELDKTKIRIPGYAVPLVGDEKGITEFLLVPYMGACIHVPAPPTNQIVYVKTAGKPLSMHMIYDAFWVTGTLSTIGQTSEYAETGYSLSADGFEVYQYN